MYLDLFKSASVFDRHLHNLAFSPSQCCYQHIDIVPSTTCFSTPLLACGIIVCEVYAKVLASDPGFVQSAYIPAAVLSGKDAKVT